MSEQEYVNWQAPVPVIRYRSLDDTGIVLHGFSTRLGGVSEDIYGNMNLSFTRGDDPKRVKRNFEIISKEIGFDPNLIVGTDQTHTANVRVVRREDAGHGITRPKNCHDIDGQVTNVPGLPLITYHADCVPLFFVDPVKKAIGLTHSGWRGTAARIGAETVHVLSETYGSDPKDIIAVIGPSIGQCCYEVSQDVADAFGEGFNINEKLISRGKLEGKYMLNLWEANRQILRAAGLSDENITITEYCTACHSDRLWSHRITGGQRGSLAAFLCLRNEMV